MKDDTTEMLADPMRVDPFAPGVIRLRQAVRATFRAVVGEAPLILRVDQGRKVIRGGNCPHSLEGIDVPEGALALLPAHVALDVENHPANDGPYRATGLLIPAGIAVPTGPSTIGATSDQRTMAAFDRALDMMRRPGVPQSIRDHAVLEVLLWLDAAGLRLPPAGPLGPVERIRQLVAQDLAHDWTAVEVAATLATSEATLRRRLAAAGTGLARLLTDLRMNRALGLLQCTDLPVTVIALEVGYASPSRFALRFRERFGLSPRAVRGD